MAFPFRRPPPAVPHERSDTAAPSPYLHGRAEFEGAFGSLAKRVRTWQIVAFGLLGVDALLSVGYVRLAATSRVVPYVVQVDRLGQVQTAGPAEELRTPDARLVASQLAEWLRRVRTVLPAAAAQAQADQLRRAYAMTAGDAVGFLNGYFADPTHDPRALGRSIARQVDVQSILAVPNSDTWRLRWVETDTPLAPGGVPRAAAYEAYATVRIAPPSTVDGVSDNPIGLLVTSLSWTRTTEAPPSAPAVGGAPSAFSPSSGGQ